MRNTERASYARYQWNDNDFPSFWRVADVNPLVSAVGEDCHRVGTDQGHYWPRSPITSER
jgi:hypothetical protein